MDGVLGSVTHSHPHTYPLVGNLYGNLCNGANPPYSPHSVGYP